MDCHWAPKVLAFLDCSSSDMLGDMMMRSEGKPRDRPIRCSRGAYWVVVAMACQSCSSTQDPGAGPGSSDAAHENGGEHDDAASPDATSSSDSSTDFIVRDAVFVETADWKSGFVGGASTVVFVSDYSDACSVLTQGGAVGP